jgi:hypothetical protein
MVEWKFFSTNLTIEQINFKIEVLLSKFHRRLNLIMLMFSTLVVRSQKTNNIVKSTINVPKTA